MLSSYFKVPQLLMETDFNTFYSIFVDIGGGRGVSRESLKVFCCAFKVLYSNHNGEHLAQLFNEFLSTNFFQITVQCLRSQGHFQGSQIEKILNSLLPKLNQAKDTYVNRSLVERGWASWKHSKAPALKLTSSDQRTIDEIFNILQISGSLPWKDSKRFSIANDEEREKAIKDSQRPQQRLFLGFPVEQMWNGLYKFACIFIALYAVSLLCKILELIKK